MTEGFGEGREGQFLVRDEMKINIQDVSFKCPNLKTRGSSPLLSGDFLLGVD